MNTAPELTCEHLPRTREARGRALRSLGLLGLVALATALACSSKEQAKDSGDQASDSMGGQGGAALALGGNGGAGGFSVEPVPCGGCPTNATCDESGEEPLCVCSPGYRPDPIGQCARDCSGEAEACGQNAECVDVGLGSLCQCAAGYQDHDGDGDCFPSCVDHTCGGHGRCGYQAGKPACTCLDGYQDRNNDLICSLDCTGEICPDSCDGIDCGGHGTCQIDGTGLPECVCDQGYQDDDEDFVCACPIGQRGEGCAECDNPAGYYQDGELCSIGLVGELTELSPGFFADGEVAATCDEYRYPALGYVYAGTTGSGYYEISVESGGSTTVYCEQAPLP